MNNLIGQHGVFRGGREVGSVTVSEEGLMTVIACTCEMLADGVLRLAGVSGEEFVSIGVVAPDAGRLRLRKSYTKNAFASLRLDESTSFYLIISGETLSGLKSAEDAPAVKLTLGARPAPPEPEPESAIEPAPEQEPVEEVKPEPGIEPEETKPAPPEIAPESGVSAVPELKKSEPPPETPRAAPPTAPELPREDAPREVGPWKPIRDPASLFSDGDIQQACRNARGALVTEREGFTMLAIPAESGEPFPMMPVFCFGTSETIGGAEYIVFKTKNGNLAV